MVKNTKNVLFAYPSVYKLPMDSSLCVHWEENIIEYSSYLQKKIYAQEKINPGIFNPNNSISYLLIDCISLCFQREQYISKCWKILSIILSNQFFFNQRRDWGLEKGYELFLVAQVLGSTTHVIPNPTFLLSWHCLKKN